MDTNVITKTMSRPEYVLTVKHETDDNSYIGSIILLPLGHEAESPESGETIFTSYPKETPEEAEQAALDYYIQLKK